MSGCLSTLSHFFRGLVQKNREHTITRHRYYLDLLVGCLEKVKQYSPKWWLNGDESHGIESVKHHQTNKFQDKY